MIVEIYFYIKGEGVLRQWNDRYSLVRVLHAIPEGEDVDIYINDNPFFKDLEVEEFTPYVYVPEGEYEITVYLAETQDNPLVRQKVKVNVSELVTIAITGNPGDIELVPIKEDTETASGNNSKVRVVHLAPNSPEVNIIVDEQDLFSNVKFRDVTEYKEVPPKVYTVEIEASSNNKLIRNDQVRINPNRIYTFYAIGNVPNVNIIQSLDGATFIS